MTKVERCCYFAIWATQLRSRLFIASCSNIIATREITWMTFSNKEFQARVQKLIVKLKLDRWDIFRRQQQEDNLVRMSTVDKDDSAFAPRQITIVAIC